MKNAETEGSGLRVLADQYYTEDKNERQTYDLVIPESARGSTGLILCIHGGGWIMGDRSCYAGPLRQAGERGYAAAAINYRYVSETVCFGDLLDDIAAALTAIRAAGEEYGVRFDRALLTGVSAGGHLSLLYAYARRDAAPVRPVCVAELCGPTDLEDEMYHSPENAIARNAGADYMRGLLSRGVGHTVAPACFEAARPALKRYSPVNYVDADAVPTFFGHGDRDDVVPYRNALALDERLTAAGVEHEFVSFPASGHACEDKAAMARFMALFFRCAARYLAPRGADAAL